jgi:hypothetical protein
VRESGCEDWTGFDELLADDIDTKIESLERAYAEEHKVIRFGENHVIGGEGPTGMYDGKADVTLNMSTIGHHESLPPLYGDVQRFKDRTRYPGEFAPRVD